MFRVLAVALVVAISPLALGAQPASDYINPSGQVLLAQGKSDDKGKSGSHGQSQGQSEGKGQGKGQGQDSDRVRGPGQDQRGPEGGKDGRAAFRDDHRRVVNDYYRKEYYSRGSCPPGLAKKNNGCLPPGQARKGYAVGQPWPRNLTFQPLPQRLLGQIGRPPSGYGYGYYDGDVIMYSQRERIITDIISTLSR